MCPFMPLLAWAFFCAGLVLIWGALRASADVERSVKFRVGTVGVLLVLGCIMAWVGSEIGSVLTYLG